MPRGLLLLACLGGFFSSAAQAALITDDYPAHPNLSVIGLYGGYTASSGSFWAEGTPQSYSHDSSGLQDLMPGLLTEDDEYLWSFSIAAELESAGSTPMPASGTVAIYGSVTGDQGAGELLLGGNIEAFGSSIDPSLAPETTLFDVSFRVTGGAYATDYGSLARIILTPAFTTGVSEELDDTPFNGNLACDFTFSGASGVADVVAIPEPCSGAMALTLLATGLVTFASRRLGMRRGV